MIWRPSTRVVAKVLQFSILLSFAGVAGAAAPVLQTAVSRMTHGAAGAFDVQLPLTIDANNSGVESRKVSSGLTIVLTFDQTVVSGTATIPSGVATVGGTSFSGATMTVSLTASARPRRSSCIWRM